MADDLVLDLTNYKDTVGNHVAPGKYPVVVEDAELGASAQKKTPQLTLWLRVVGGEFDGSTLVENLYLTDGSTFRVVGFLQALGIPTPRKKLQFKLRQFLNRRVYVIVEDDTYNNRTRSRVAGFERYVAPEGSEPVDDLAGLDEFVANSEAVDLPEEEVALEGPGNPASTFVGEEEAAPAVTPVAPPAEVAAPAAAAPEEEPGDEDSEAIDLDDLDL